MDGPKHQAYGVPPQGEEDHDAFQQAAEIARWSKELHLNERAASDLYDKNHDLIMQFLGTNPTLYVELLKIICDNKNLRREKAQGIYEDKLTQYMQGHKKEPEDPEKSNQHVEPHTSPAPPPASMPSSISAVPQDTSRCNSILLDSIEVVSPAPLPETRPEDLADAVADAAPISKDQTARESQQPASTPAVSAIAPSEAPQTADDKLRSAASSAYNHTDEAPKDMNSNKRPASTELQQQPAAKRPKEHSNPQAVPAKPAGDQNGQPDHKKKKKKKHSLKASHATPLTDRTITFDEVANNQMHYDTIVEYPPGCGNYYILFCKEHSVHFKYKLPIGGAAKHLFSPLHGEPKKSWPRAVELLGYLVTGCNDQLKTEHNRKVEKKFESGHIPQNQRSKFLPPKKPPQAKPPAPPAAKAQMQTPSTPKPSAPAPGDRPKDITTPPSAWANGIFYPKTFHIYQAKWGTGNGATHYPVMILDWDSQADSGLGGTLNDTQLLDAGGDPPGCYQYDQPVEKIIGWEDGYEDGGPKVASRKFPVLFFDAQKSAAWIFGRSLKRYPLYEDLQDQKERKKQLEVRRWIARREGFTTWKERQTVQPGATFDEARLNLPQDESSPQIPYTRSPSVATTLEQSVQITNPEEDVDGGSEAMDMDDSDSSLDCETSQDAELKKLLETAGEIPGDQDYTDSQETADPDLDMADTASPSKAYRKSFISTRSTDKGDTVLVTASSGRLRGTPANVSRGRPDYWHRVAPKTADKSFNPGEPDYEPSKRSNMSPVCVCVYAGG
ncbi:uncharacterized protein B0I36DRAFT_350501 [Microdochium trichocladiopsis]|uniref:Uncharacterized protein n=1 Tax=Microdochium trichocladiopsis TaxID=1682393 RepID=A0A9P9BPZ6_9PEZI|nr:uncharacterized protein B0I36DRAFT_350501 [Microdochium trichocladiopsis]KAH7029665.1 hypothetical protein B0I36DRAFT_350501 [Microdochium trichocladiopsis]